MNNLLLDDQLVKKILTSSKTIAMVGVSSLKKDDPGSIKRRPSTIVMKYLQEFGYRVIPVNPFSAGKMIYGENIIDKLEDYHRGLYTGCLGTIKNNGDMDFNICIRTMTINNNIATYPVGGGIVWDSTFEDEYIEAKEKANILNY